MVQRTSQEVQFQGGTGVQIQGGAGGMAGVDANKYRRSRERTVGATADGASNRLLDVITGIGNQLADKYTQTEREEAYLSGAAAAGTGIAESELEANPLTRDWAKAGYRDTVGRVALAESEAKIIEDMPKMREQTPEKYAEYLAQRRTEMLAQIKGMSRKQRAGAVQNLLMNDRAAIKKHTVEHAKFQIETEARSVQAANRVAVAGMGAAKNDLGSYVTSTEAAFSTAQNSILNNDKLPLGIKANMVAELAEFALADDHQKLYEMLQTKEVDLPGGGKGPMVSLLSWDDSVKLSKVYRESLNRTKTIRAMEFQNAQARMQADWDNPHTPLMPESEMLSFVERGIREEFMQGEAPKAFQLDYYKASTKKASEGAAGAAWAAGDSGTLIGLNATDVEGGEAWMKKYGSKMKPAELTSSLIHIGLVQGRPAALNILGKQLAPAFAQLGLNSNMDPANVAMLGTTLQTLDAAEQTGRTGVFSAVLSAVPQDTAAKIMDIRENMRAGLPFDQAVASSINKLSEYSKMAPALRTAMGEGNAKEDLEMLQSLEPVGILDRLGLGLKSIVSTDAGNRLGLSVKQSWRENDERVAEAGAAMKFAAAEELRVLNQTHPFMSKEARQSTVLATLRGRTVSTEQGPIVLPRGTTVQSYFGVSASTSAERVGAALDEFVQPAPGNRLVYSIANGNMYFKELNKDGGLVRPGTINPKAVAQMVETQRERAVEQHKAIHGPGRTINGVQFNGENTGGLDMGQVFNMRQNILQGGEFTVGQMSSENFKIATDKAATYAKLPMRTTGKTGTEALTLFSSLALVTNFKFTSQKEYRPLLQALSGTDQAAALKAVADTPVYKEANERERAHLMMQVTKIMKGM